MILHTVVYGTPSLSLILALFRFFIKCRVKMTNLCYYFALQCLWVLRASELSLFSGAARFSLISGASFSSQYLQFSNSLPFLWCLDSLIHFSHRVYSDRVCLISGVTDSNPLPSVILGLLQCFLMILSSIIADSHCALFLSIQDEQNSYIWGNMI